MCTQPWRRITAQCCHLNNIFRFIHGFPLTFLSWFDLAAARKRKRNRGGSLKLSLPGVLRFVTSDYGRDEDVMILLRGTVCQALYFNNNTKARNAAKEGTMKDMALGQ